MSPTPPTTPIKVPLPRHLLPPGQEGYRTPTIEDGEGHTRFLPHFASSSAVYRHRSLVTPSTPPILEHEKMGSRDEVELPKKLPIKIRLRHFTWSYFTLTMATGGIANVIHAGTNANCIIVKPT